jgi:hypothetical protein
VAPDCSAMELDFIGLPAPHKEGGIRCLALADNPSHGMHPRCFGQQTQLFQSRIEIRIAEVNAHQNGGRFQAFRGC